ncbi:hypothetical protein XFF6990_140201 [Xanthomonas citri pv. fuscans]|uniref:Uncharacterized protein n=1 Tax=Xanthomonas campestris pv. phaseoli TaxID=317013 RepID=A0A7Z7NEP6_XANCH|nr:hypothetical protein XFF6990_140201 [Xanthomonas citri pv. fuscans]SOO22122.1 hypothetical protein XFF6991_110010 [Xanthomonas phaseoli pv. phaseoli]
MLHISWYRNEVGRQGGKGIFEASQEAGQPLESYGRPSNS